MPPHVYTLGDSTLDNLYWLINDDASNLEEAKESSAEGQLQEKLKGTHNVISLAYDGFTTKDVLGENTKRIGVVLPKHHQKFYSYLDVKKYEGSTYVKPLEALQKSLPDQGDHYVAISVGGNDFRENLTRPFRLIGDIPKVQGRYLEIVDKVKGLSTKDRNVYPILMLQYRTDAKNDPYMIYTLFGIVGAVAFAINLLAVGLILTPLAFIAVGGTALIITSVVCPIIGILGLYLTNKIVPLSVSLDMLTFKKPSHSLFGAMLKKLYAPILREARKSKIPVLDLPNTFNPNKDLYDSGIEPNVEGGKLIAEGLAHIVKEHSFEGESLLYAKTDGDDKYRATPNTSKWSVAYPAKVKAKK